MQRSGTEALVQQLKADGVEYVFGNPGTVEEGLLDALNTTSGITYVLALQETVALAMADGYARASRKPGIVQLHSGVGLGNGIGMLYQAMRGHAPLVVVAGEAGRRYDALDAQMAADLIGMARPVTKWAARAIDPESVLRLTRRAVKIALTPPMGPVFLALPMDVLDAPNCEPVVPTPRLVTRVVPDPTHVAAAAEMLVHAQRPALLLGDGVAASGAQLAVAHIAEMLGAEIWGADSSEVNVPADHLLFRGQLGHMFGTDSRRMTSQADVVLVCGTYVLPEVFPALDGVFAPDARVIHIDLDAYEIAKNFPVDLGLVSDPKLTLEALAQQLEAVMSASSRNAARTRAMQIAALKEQTEHAQRQRDMAVREDVPLHASRFMEELGAALPSDAIVFDEALTCSPHLTRYVPPITPGHYFQTRGGSLGTGIPGALGIKLARPDKTVIGVSGDGGSMYTIQALWTAAHHRIGAKFVVCNNRSYELLKVNIQHYWQTSGRSDGIFPSSFDLRDPDLRFDKLAQSLGVPAVRVELPDQIGPAIRQALAHDGPFLIDAAFTSALS